LNFRHPSASVRARTFGGPTFDQYLAASGTGRTLITLWPEEFSTGQTSRSPAVIPAGGGGSLIKTENYTSAVSAEFIP
jgi:hypothetical protein